MEEKAKELAILLKLLANENRLLILCSLIKSATPLTVNELLKKMNNITQSGLSQHLSVLKSHKILTSEKNGQYVAYKIKDDKILVLIGVLKNLYCD